MTLLRRTMITSFISICLLVPLLAVAKSAPGFTLMNAEGDKVSLTDFQGKPLVLHFWASWCPYCTTVQPGLEALIEEYADDELVVLAVNFREDDGVQPQAVLAGRGLTFSTLLQGDSAAIAYGVRGTPTTFFINAEGEIVGMTNTSKAEDPELRSLADLATGRTSKAE
ncbi:MAG: TlpA disulfide reductase family protein [Pseudomonadota bacterium]